MNQLMFDYQILLMQKYGGISRYFYEVISRVPLNEFDLNFSVINNLNYYFEDYFGQPIREINNPKKYRRIIKKNQAITKKTLKKSKDNIIFHPTYFNPYFLESLQGKLILTVHDMIHEKYPEYYAGNATIGHKKSLMERADRIIAVSEATRNDILDIYPSIDESKIAVVYHGSDQKKQVIINTEYERKYKQNGAFLLYVGNRDRYKNFINMANAVSHILAQRSDLKLICVGGGDFLSEEKDIFERNKCLGQVVQVNAGEEELNWLYQNAECFVFSSKAEGFGIPILEAWKNECPVVLSDMECFREIGGNAVLYFDPDSIAAMEEKIASVLRGEAIRDKLIKLGNERLKSFSWDLCAQKHIQIYRDECNRGE